MTKYEIAVFGSCISRDIFNSHFVEDYKENFQVSIDQQHVTIPSLMSQPVLIDDSEELTGNVTPYFKGVFLRDLSKEFLNDIMNVQPPYMLIDFYVDVYYGFRKMKQTSCKLFKKDVYITNKIWQYKRLNYYSQLELDEPYTFMDNPDKAFKIWKKNLVRFIAFMRKYSPNTKIILNTAKLSNSIIVDGETKKLSEIRKDAFDEEKIEHLNNWWRKLDQYFIEKYQPLVLTVEKNYHCDPNHRWGMFYVHYENEYYKNAYHQLIKILEK
ncbi:DUF6270 domain-containing protein [Vagococcus zengguangii]|uniref:DUF6270 domain-containing protein n=1 Tax=Vagococcus zengguangii TaxID=2571750 RepID=UPI001107B563|nr:DUF6270 domain-containing protein [Vagococcus zengguangii]TLG80920.1 hypothetical protein FE258_03265 [Vagococcus zengguangii]